MPIEFHVLDRTSKATVTNDEAGQMSQLLRQLSPNAPDRTPVEILRISQINPIFLAREDGRVVGMATLVISDQLVGLRGYVHDVVVDELQRGKGISKELMKQLHAKAKELGVEKLQLTSKSSRIAANALYKKIGYTPVETNVYEFDLRLGFWRDGM